MYEEIKQHRYKTEDFYRYADKNLYTKGLGLKWLSKNGQNMDTVQNPNSPSEFIDPQVIVDYILEHPTKSKEPGFMGNIDNVNETFNQFLKKHIAGSLKFPFVYQFGMPSQKLLDAGLSKLNIELDAERLEDKSKQAEHPFELKEVFDLADNVHNPIIVFESSTVKNTFLIFVENAHAKGKKNFVVVIRKTKNNFYVNYVRSVYPRENTKIINAIVNKNILWVDKEKALKWICKPQHNAVDVTNQRRSPRLIIEQCKSIIKNFENKKNVSTKLGGLEPMDMNTPSQIIETKTKGQFGEWLQGYENKEYAIVLRGEKGAGKTRLLHQLMNFFVVQENKKIAFLSLEQDKNSGIAQSLFKEYIEHKALENIHVTSNTTGLKELEQIAKSKQYDVIAIDSFTKIKDIKQEDFDMLRKKYPHIIWLLIFQSTTGKVTRGGNMPEYDASVVIQVNKGGNAILEKNRYGNTHNFFNVFEQKISNRQ